MQGKLVLKLRPKSEMVFFLTLQLSLLILSNFHLFKKNRNKVEETKKPFKNLCVRCFMFFKDLLLVSVSYLHYLHTLT